VRKLASQTIDVVFIPAQAPELTIMMRDAATLVPSMRFIGSDMLAIPYIEPVVAADSDRLILMLPWPDRSSFSDTASKPQHPTMAQSGEAMARLAIEIWAHAVAHAGSPDPEEIAPILTSQAAPTRAGPIRFDGHGDAEVPSYTPHVWRDGRWSPFEAQRP